MIRFLGIGYAILLMGILDLVQGLIAVGTSIASFGRWLRELLYWMGLLFITWITTELTFILQTLYVCLSAYIDTRPCDALIPGDTSGEKNTLGW